MISATQTNTTQIADDIIGFLDSHNAIVKRIGDRVGARIKPLFLDELRYYPPKLPNQKYVRTYRLRDSFSVEYTIDNGVFTMVAKSTPPGGFTAANWYAPYVVGVIDFRSRAAAIEPIASIHAGRWTPFIDTILFWFDATDEEFKIAYDEEIGAAFGSVGRQRRGRKQ